MSPAPKSHKPVKRTPTKRIESVKDPHLESVHLKFSGELFGVSAKRGRSGVNVNKKKVDKLVNQRRIGKSIWDATGYSTVHTHPLKERIVDDLGTKRQNPTLPSSEDINEFMNDFGSRSMIIAQTHPKSGKVAGYYFLRKTYARPKVVMPEHPTRSYIDIGLDDYRQIEARGGNASNLEREESLRKVADNLGIHLRTVVNKKAGTSFVYKPGRGFVRTESK